MQRRHFFKLMAVASAALAGCAVTVQGERDDDVPEPRDGATPESDAATVSDASARDGATLVVDASTAPADVSFGEGVMIAESFDVILNDTMCSGHSHELSVVAGTYPPGVRVRFLGGSHLVELDPSELLALQRGERIPFATTGPGPGHGHCGVAWRREVGPEDRTRRDACMLHNTTAVCTQRL